MIERENRLVVTRLKGVGVSLQKGTIVWMILVVEEMFFVLIETMPIC